MRKKVSIELDEDLLKRIEKRAKNNYLSVREQLKDIIVRSMANYGKPSRNYGDPKVSKMVKIFSRKKSGPKPKKKK